MIAELAERLPDVKIASGELRGATPARYFHRYRCRQGMVPIPKTNPLARGELRGVAPPAIFIGIGADKGMVPENKPV